MHTGKIGAIIERIKSDGDINPADLLITVDAGSLWRAEQDGLLQAVHSLRLEENIPAHLRSDENFWYGLSVRARTIFITLSGLTLICSQPTLTWLIVSGKTGYVLELVNLFITNL